MEIGGDARNILSNDDNIVNKTQSTDNADCGIDVTDDKTSDVEKGKQISTRTFRKQIHGNQRNRRALARAIYGT